MVLITGGLYYYFLTILLYRRLKESTGFYRLFSHRRNKHVNKIKSRFILRDVNLKSQCEGY